jgi:nickel/cobalt transporter (NicO) family protein
MKALLIAILLFSAAIVSAHPMGNFSINHYSAISISEKGVSLDYIIDLAEIPTFQEMEFLDLDQDHIISKLESDQYAAKKGQLFAEGLFLIANEKPLSLKRIHSKMTVVSGAAGLPTLAIRNHYFATWKGQVIQEQNKIAFSDRNYSDRIGWKEIVLRAGSAKPVGWDPTAHQDRSKELTVYPDDATSSPPQETEIDFQFELPKSTAVIATTISKPVPNSIETKKVVANEPEKQMPSIQKPPAQPVVKTVSTPISKRDDSFTRLITAEQLTGKVILVSLLIAFALGSMHALSPGHGKAIVAGYLVGSRGTAWHALFLGAVVTLTHTIGVFLLGFITLFGSRYILPEDLYPWLGFLSGMSIVIIGISLFRKRLRAMPSGHSHSQDVRHHDAAHHTHHHHDHHHDHDDHHHSHQHNHDDHHHGEGGTHDHHGHSHLPVDSETGAITWKSLLTVGISGGALPCPSALVVLLSAISLHRVGFGLLLIVAFSLGLAVVLTSIGVLFVYASSWTRKIRFSGTLLYRMPLVSSLVISVLGFAIAIRSLMQV